MIKKIIMIGLLVLTSAVLVLGGINRTMAKTVGITLLQWMGNEPIIEGYRSAGGEGINLSLNTEASSEWVDIEGVVTSVNDLAMQMELLDGQAMVLEDQAWEYALTEGFQVKKGDTLQLTGFYEGEDLEVSVLHNLTSGQEVRVRDETGRPMWAGRGRGNQN